MWPDDNKIVENTKGFTVIRDTREQKNKGWFWEPGNRCCGTIEDTLKTGDYTIKGAESFLRIERKASVAEIATNLSESRFPAFLERFSQFKNGFMICECSFDDVMMFPVGSNIPKHMWPKIEMKGKFLRKKLAEIQLKYHLNIIWAGNASNAWDMADSIFKRVYDDILKGK